MFYADELPTCRFELLKFRAFNLELLTRTTLGECRLRRGCARTLRADAGRVVGGRRARAGNRVSANCRWTAGAECLRRFAKRGLERRSRFEEQTPRKHSQRRFGRIVAHVGDTRESDF